MRKIIVTREITQYSDKCSKCGKWIKGDSESQVRYNMKIHNDAKHGGVFLSEARSSAVRSGRVSKSKSRTERRTP